MTPVLAAGFNDVAKDYGVSTQQVAYTTGLYMLGLGFGSVIMAPTAILWGKRPVYLLGATLFILSAVWCALSTNYPSLVVARIFMGIAVSPVECLPSATIAEIFFYTRELIASVFIHFCFSEARILYLWLVLRLLEHWVGAGSFGKSRLKFLGAFG